MSEERYLTFEQAMQALGLSEDELFNLVAANEIRAFRIDREMKFKEADVKAMVGAKAGGGGGDDQVVSIEDADVVMVESPASVDTAPAVDAGEEADLDIGEIEDLEGLEIEDVEDATVEDTGATPAAADGQQAAEDVVSLEKETAAVDESSATEEIELEDEDMGTVVMGDDDLVIDTDGAGEEAATELGAVAASQTEPVLEGASKTDGLGTEEIVFEDEDLAVGSLDEEAAGTQEVTVQEQAIGDDQDVTIAEEDMEVTVAEGAGSGSAASRRAAAVSARASARISQRRREIAVTQAKGNYVMDILLVATVLIMTYLSWLFAAVTYKGFSTQPEVNPSSKITMRMVDDGQVPELGAEFIPEQFRWAHDKLAPIAITAGRNTQTDTATYNLQADEPWGRPRTYNPNEVTDDAPAAATPAGGEGGEEENQPAEDNVDNDAGGGEE